MLVDECSIDLGEWTPELRDVMASDWFSVLMQKVDDAYRKNDPPVYPERVDLFTALRLTAPKNIKCVIIGQDPYHEYGQAHGLSFSVNKGIPIPRSLRNIYKELNADLDISIPEHGCLMKWAEQGVLLLNNVLTVYDGAADSHKKWGWEKFTSAVIDVVERQPQPIAYVLWGKNAQQKITTNNLGKGEHARLIHCSNHPSPLSASRGFLGSKPFSKVNAFLIENGVAPIDWSID
jgi:uracil-DNA glycosylase